MAIDQTRLNKVIAQSTEFSRRGADEIIGRGRVTVNDQLALVGQTVGNEDVIKIDDEKINNTLESKVTTIMLNKPKGYVCSRDGQGSRTIYELLSQDLVNLNSVGRLDKHSSGLLLLTNDGQLAQNLTHPSYQKVKIYEVELNKSLLPLHQQMISDFGLQLEDGLSKLQIEKQGDSAKQLLITMHEGRNRQIRRTFESLGYRVIKLHRIKFGQYDLGDLGVGETNFQ